MLIREWDKCLITSDTRLLEAMKHLNELEHKTLFIVEDGKVLASLTDGDVRRWILSNGSLEAQASEVAHNTPRCIHGEELPNANKLLKKYDVDVLPLLDETDRVIGIYADKHSAETHELLDMPVVIMAGGKGTRLYPYTKILPKPLIPIGEMPICEHIINRFYEQGSQRFYMILNYKKSMIKAYFGDVEHDYELDLLEEPAPLGTGGGLALLRGKLNETFIFTNCDTLITEPLSEALKMHRSNKNAVTMVCSMKNYTIPYGIIDLDDEGRIAQMREKPNISFLTNTGTYIVEPYVIDLIADNEVITFPEIIKRCQQQGMQVSVYPISEDSWLDMGQFTELEQMKRKLSIND